MAAVWVNEHVERRDTFHEGAVVVGVDDEFCFDVSFNVFPIVNTLVGVIRFMGCVVDPCALSLFGLRLFPECVSDL